MRQLFRVIHRLHRASLGFIGFSILATQAANAQTTQSMMTLQISRQFLSSSISATPPQARNFCEWSNGYLNCGTQWLQSTSDIALSPANDHAMFGLRYNSQVTSAVQTYIDGEISDRYVSFNTATNGSTIKWSRWTLQGLENVFASETMASTSVYNQGTSGILFRGIALGQLENRIGTIQQTANNELAARANESMDLAGGQQLEAMGSAYRGGPFSEYIADGTLPGNTVAQSTTEALYLQTFVQDDIFSDHNRQFYGDQGDLLPPWGIATPDVGWRISDKFLKTFAKNLLGGGKLPVSEVRRDFEKLCLMPYVDHSETFAPIPKVDMRFNADNPLTIDFGRNEIHVLMNIAEFDGHPLPAIIDATYALSQEQDEVVAVRTAKLTGVPADAPSEFAVTAELLLPPKLTMDAVGNGFSPTFLAKFMTLSTARTENGWMLLGWRL